MSRRQLTVLAATLLALSLGVIGATLPVPFVALGVGPTYNLLADIDTVPIIAIEGLPSYPNGDGNLNMTTVSVSTDLSMLEALDAWASGRVQIVPKEPLFPSTVPVDEIDQQNRQQFDSSEISAESAAAEHLGLPGVAVVAATVPGSPAATELAIGDEIVEIGGRAVERPDQVAAFIGEFAVGDAVDIVVIRDRERRTSRITLGSGPDSTKGFLGVVVGKRLRPGAVEVELGGIGGPSAGLMLSLTIVDLLTEGDLTRGHFIAGTGSVNPLGAVGGISGIRFKMIAAREAGATTFLVPRSNCAEALQAAPPGLMLVAIDSLGDAVAATAEISRVGDRGAMPDRFVCQADH